VCVMEVSDDPGALTLKRRRANPWAWRTCSDSTITSARQWPVHRPKPRAAVVGSIEPARDFGRYGRDDLRP
jgi:hypothetical protein